MKRNNQIKITARTLQFENASTTILKKNGFRYLKPFIDPDDGEVWDWVYVGNLP